MDLHFKLVRYNNYVSCCLCHYINDKNGEQKNV